MSYYENRIKALEEKVAEMARMQRHKAIPVEAKLIERIAEYQAENTRLKAEVESLKEKMKELPTHNIGDRWYTEAQFNMIINDARIWRL